MQKWCFHLRLDLKRCSESDQLRELQVLLKAILRQFCRLLSLLMAKDLHPLLGIQLLDYGT